jgi:hypothetical protein
MYIAPIFPDYDFFHRKDVDYSKHRITIQSLVRKKQDGIWYLTLVTQNYLTDSEPTSLDISYLFKRFIRDSYLSIIIPGITPFLLEKELWWVDKNQMDEPERLFLTNK